MKDYPNANISPGHPPNKQKILRYSCELIFSLFLNNGTMSQHHIPLASPTHSNYRQAFTYVRAQFYMLNTRYFSKSHLFFFRVNLAPSSIVTQDLKIATLFERYKLQKMLILMMSI